MPGSVFRHPPVDHYKASLVLESACGNLGRQMSGATQARFPGPEWKESAQHKAEGILAEELSRRGWDERTLAERRKADPEKLRMARRFRSETTMTWRWIAQHLHMGAPGYVRNSLRAREE
jgi:hypothetical protein